MIDILTALGDFVEFKRMMVAHRKGRDNGLVVTSAPVVAPGVETRHHQEAKMGMVGALSIKTAASAEGGCVYQKGVLGAEEKATRRGEADAGRQQASGISSTFAESK